MKKNTPVHSFSDELDSEYQFKIVPIEKRNTYDSSAPHRHNYYELFFFTRGGGTHMIDFINHKIKSQSIHIVFPGQVHKVKRKLDTNGFVLMFSNDFYYMNNKETDALSEIPNKLRSNFSPILNLSSRDYIKTEAIVKRLIEELKSDGIFMREILKSFLDIILFTIKENLKNTKQQNVLKKENVSYELFYRFSTLLENNFKKLHRPNDYAEMLSVSEKQLNKFSKYICGKNVGTLIQDRIILEIKRLLTHSVSSKEISIMLNFKDPSYFLKFFKKKAGLTPKDFQSDFRKKYHF